MTSIQQVNSDDFISYKTGFCLGGEPTYWKKLDDTQLQLVKSIVSRVKGNKTITSVKECIVDEVLYAKEKEDVVGLYEREWRFVIESLDKKANTKGARNKEEMQHLIKIISRFLKTELKPNADL